MKYLFVSFMFILLLPTFAKAEICSNDMPEILDSDLIDSLEAFSDEDKEDFKRRPMRDKRFHTLFNIETNFIVPIVGEDKYFGRVYIVDGDTDKFHYRDELIAERKYKKEIKDKVIFADSYPLNKLSESLSLVNALGAEVTMHSTNFTTTQGGTIYFKVKAPLDEAYNLVIDVKIKDGIMKNYLVHGHERTAFDSLMINANDSKIGKGIESLVFSKGGKLAKEIKN